MSSSNIETLSVAAFQAGLLFYVYIVRGESLGGSEALFSLAVLWKDLLILLLQTKWWLVPEGKARWME